MKFPAKAKFCILLYFENYFDEIYETMVDAIVDKKLKVVIDKIKTETPPPMNKMLSKQPRSEHIQKKYIKENMPIIDVPPSDRGR